MTAKEFLPIEKELLTNFPEFSIQRTHIFYTPIGHVLKGLVFGRSIVKRDFYVNWFLMPLCVPTTFLWMNTGDQLRHSKFRSWDRNMPDLSLHLDEAMRTQVMPVFGAVNSLDDYIAFASGMPRGGTRKSIAYALALAGRDAEAVEVLDEMMSNLNLKIQWQQDLRDEATELKAKILRNPDEARQQLLEWEEESVRNLKLEKYRATQP